MNQTQTTVRLCNTALGRLGGHQLASINSPDEDSALAALSRTFLPLVIDTALGAHSWPFALAAAQLAPKTGSIEGYPCRFALPSDCVQPLLLEGGGAWRVMGQDIYADTSTANLHYTVRADDPRQWTAAFFSAVAWALAAELSTAVVNDVRRQQLCAQEYTRALETAKAESLNAENPYTENLPWIAART